MKAIVLCAGFGTRLEKDLQNDSSGQYKHLIGVPKPLLPIGNEPLITHWARTTRDVPDVDTVYVVTNAANNDKFVTWSKCWPKVKVVSDGADNNETRSGAVACIQLAVSDFSNEDDVLIIAGDTLFYDDFHLPSYINKFNDFKLKDPDANMLLYVTCLDEEVHKYGILETDMKGRVMGFLEKPQPEETTSRKEDQPLKERDATGMFIAYLYKRWPVYAVEISGRFDVGGLETYLKCCDYFADRKTS
ncbi:hypothetical protein LSH36_15g09073 [Paralvinella palmiformis]|uniref:Nucleotidyl transferase domain-containing protein n=1 Tax=Paralvinella palmiformis TaxID=53620 RepID=A0AAD9KCK4_9ANNE|nr:hypothetical protein LSH36_15g09073 [Paralvinella palmiformis]